MVDQKPKYLKNALSKAALLAIWPCIALVAVFLLICTLSLLLWVYVPSNSMLASVIPFVLLSGILLSGGLFVSLMTTITALKKRSAKRKAALDQFTYIVSHDLKAPLRHLSLCSDVLSTDYKDALDGEGHDYLDMMKRGTNRMTQMIEALVTYSRLNRGSMSSFVPCSVTQVIDDIKESLKNESKGQIIADDLPSVRADETLLMKLMTELIDNAIKYAKDDIDPIITVTTSPTSKRGYRQITITDNGIGIDPKFSDKIFQIFQTLHREGLYPGVGIGLSLCRKIVELHGGGIWLDETYKDGVRIHFTLPA